MKNNREVSDSLLATKPQYMTKNGRTVYGGGGITPDIYSNIDLNLSNISKDILYHPQRPLFKYANIIKNQLDNNNSLNSYNQLHLLNTYSTIDLNVFVDWLINNDIQFEHEINIDSLNINWDFMHNRIKAEVASNLWGKNNYYHELLNNDSQFLEALNTFKQYNELLK